MLKTIKHRYTPASILGAVGILALVLFGVCLERSSKNPPKPSGDGSSTTGSDASLDSLELSGVTLMPAFASDTTSYTADVANTVMSVTVTATPIRSAATVAITGTAAGGTDLTVSDMVSGMVSGVEVSGLSVGTNTITITVTAADSTTMKVYTVMVRRAADPLTDPSLSSLILSDVALMPAFAPDTFSYTADVVNTVMETMVTATTTNSNATLAVNGMTAVSAMTMIVVPLSNGANMIMVVVTAEDTTTMRTYTITVTRAGPIAPGAPGAPMITSPTDGSVTNDTTPTFQVTVTEMGGTLTLVRYMQSGGTCGAVPEPSVSNTEATVSTGVVTGPGANALTPGSALSEDTHCFAVYHENAGSMRSPASDAIALRVDTTPPILAPGAPMITSPTDGSVTNDTTPTFQVTATEMGGTLTLVRYMQSGGTCGVVPAPIVSNTVATLSTGVVTGPGANALTPGSALSEETHCLAVYHENAGSMRSPASGAIALRVDTTPPTFTLSPADGVTGIAVGTDIVITVDEAIRMADGTAISDSNLSSLITLTEMVSPASPTMKPYTASIVGNVITINPDSDFASGSTVRLQFAAVEDAAGNDSMAVDISFTIL